MKKYVLDVSIGQSNTAGQKAKADITSILVDNGFKKIELNLRRSKILKLLTTKIKIKEALKKVNKDDIFVIQYPLYSRFATGILLDECKKNGIKTIAVIHDVESLRLYKNDSPKIKQELSFFERFNCVISHNDIMTNWLKKNGLKTELVSLELFDYLNKHNLVEANKESNLVFAGNLGKSNFLEKWSINKSMTVYGINPSDNYPKQINYRGVRSPDELPKFLSGSFGLVWDGDSLNTNTGIYGEYTRYNNPHKVSLYLSCGLPVIVWKDAAIAKFIESNNLGITISCIQDIETCLNDMSNEQYKSILENVKEVSKKVRNGYFTINAVNLATKRIKDFN